jgi:phage terminase Nu1 subunit (DNA packaging protein)
MNEKITIELDSETMEAVRLHAKANGHDVASEVREMVRQRYPRVARGDIDFVSEFRRIRAMTPKGVTQTDSTKIIRESRDRDH